MASGIQADAISLKGFRKGLKIPLVIGGIMGPPAKLPCPGARYVNGGHKLSEKRAWPENEQRMLLTDRESMT